MSIGANRGQNWNREARSPSSAKRLILPHMMIALMVERFGCRPQMGHAGNGNTGKDCRFDDSRSLQIALAFQ